VFRIIERLTLGISSDSEDRPGIIH